MNDEQRLEFENEREAPYFRTGGQFTLHCVNGIYESIEIAYKDAEDWKVVARIPLEIIHEQPEPEQQSEPN